MSVSTTTWLPSPFNEADLDTIYCLDWDALIDRTITPWRYDIGDYIPSNLFLRTTSCCEVGISVGYELRSSSHQRGKESELWGRYTLSLGVKATLALLQVIPDDLRIVRTRTVGLLLENFRFRISMRDPLHRDLYLRFSWTSRDILLQAEILELYYFMSSNCFIQTWIWFCSFGLHLLRSSKRRIDRRQWSNCRTRLDCFMPGADWFRQWAGSLVAVDVGCYLAVCRHRHCRDHQIHRH